MGGWFVSSFVKISKLFGAERIFCRVSMSRKYYLDKYVFEGEPVR